MKRILWAGLLILSFNTHAFFEDEEAREKINDLQNQLNSLKSDQLRSLEDKVTDLQQVLQVGASSNLIVKSMRYLTIFPKSEVMLKSCSLISKVLKIVKR